VKTDDRATTNPGACVANTIAVRVNLFRVDNERAVVAVADAPAWRCAAAVVANMVIIHVEIASIAKGVAIDIRLLGIDSVWAIVIAKCCFPAGTPILEIDAVSVTVVEDAVIIVVGITGISNAVTIAIAKASHSISGVARNANASVPVIRC
jgi:hypothetical protein